MRFRITLTEVKDGFRRVEQGLLCHRCESEVVPHLVNSIMSHEDPLRKAGQSKLHFLLDGD